ncbi:MAG: 6-phosphogluconolactonase [Acidimicrobiales bacterium]
MNVEVLVDAEALATRAMEIVVAAAVEAIGERGLFVWAVSGGTTPRRMLELLRESSDLDWSRVHLCQVDERVAPADHADRNATMLREALLSPDFLERHDVAGVHLMPVEAPDLDEAAYEYAATIDALAGAPVVLDLVQLGLGSDGHTASLIPGDDVLEVADRDVALTGDYQGRRRMTLTWPVLDRAKQQLWVIGGESKQVALSRYLDNDPGIPATLPTQARATVLVDEAAWGTGGG